MQTFLQLLSIYYMCDVAAALRPLDFEEVVGCTATYELVKQHFAPEFDLAPHGTPERVAQNRAAYLGFRAWQDENADLVADLRQDALDEMLGRTTRL